MPALVVTVLLVLVGPSTLVRAQPAPRAVERTHPDTLLHEQWTVADGLPVNHANALYQTPDGYLWLATFDGLVRFDGLAFTVYNASNTPGLPSSRIRQIKRGRGSSFWLATEQGDLIRWTVGGHFKTFDVPHGYLYTTVSDGDSLTWIATGRSGLYRYGDGRLTSPFDEVLQGYSVTDVRRDQGGTLWVGTHPDGAWRSDAGGLMRATLPADLNLTTTTEEIYLRDFSSRCPDSTSWMGSGTSIRRGRQPVVSTTSTITDFLCDRAGSAWVTTRGDGVHRYGHQLLRTYGEREGVGLSNVYSVYEDRSGALWFAGRGGTVSRLQDGIFRHFAEGVYFAAKSGPAVYNSDQVLYEDQAGNLWLGFQVCTPDDRDADGLCRSFDWAPGAPQRNGVYAIRQTQRGTLWFGTMEGLYRLDEDGWTVFTIADGLSDDHVRYLLEASDGTLYAATLRGGVLRYRDGTFTALTAADGLPSNHIRALYEDAEGLLWIGTEDRGLARYDPATGTVATVRQADGLYYDGIHQIVEDDAGRLWMSTNRGLFWVYRTELDAFIEGESGGVTSIVYTERDGMRNREANGGRQQAALKASDGRLWFATQSGAVVVDPADVAPREPSPQPIIEQVTASGSVHTSFGPRPLALSADERTFAIAYTAPTFTAPDRVRFRYRLDGFDEDWVTAGQRREATYTKVPPGRYVFRVAALSPAGVWTEHEAALPLTVAPFFYETWWFAVLTGGAVLLLLGAGYRIRTRHLQLRQERLEARVAEQTRSLRTEKEKLRHAKQKTEQQAAHLREMDQIKSRFFTNVSHELRTPLTLTIGPLEDLQASEARALPATRDKVDLALRNSRRLLRLINQLLDVAKLESGTLRLNAQRADLARVVRRLARSFVPLAERRRVRFTIDLPETSLPAIFDAEKMEQVLTNLLSNAFKFTPKGGSVHVGISAGEGNAHPVACITIRDSGPGIDPEVVPRLFERFYQVEGTRAEVQPGTGIGLSLTKDLVELHGGTIVVESTVGAGTAFIVRLPRCVSTAEGEFEDTSIVTTLLAPGVSDAEVPSGDGHAACIVPAATEEDLEAREDRETEEDRTTLLVADDNAEIRAYVRSHFEPRYRVLEAADGHVALETARRALPDLIISDVMMPHLDGFELLQALQADRETDFLPVLLLTARATDEDKIKGLTEGADAYLAKPFNMRELQARVENLITSRKRLKERFAATPVDTLPSHDNNSPPGVPAGDNSADLTASEAAYVERARAAVEARVSDDNFGVEELASALRQSRSTLHRKLRDILGLTPSVFIREIRLQRAATLLEKQRGTVSEVAYAVGFKSVSHFSQAFRDRYDVSPSAYLDAVAS